MYISNHVFKLPTSSRNTYKYNINTCIYSSYISGTEYDEVDEKKEKKKSDHRGSNPFHRACKDNIYT